MSLLKSLFSSLIGVLGPVNHTDRPIAIGGIGGSGTRMIAQLLRDVGYYIGSDLNEPNDNLWAALMFNRRDVMIESRQGFERHADIFFARMRGELAVDRDVTALVKELVRPRMLHTAEWLEERADSFLTATQVVPTGKRWGWKLPATHVVADRLLEHHPGLRYIHVVRHGADMAFSTNQNQLKLWGPVFLDRDVEIGPRDSLAYWCAVQRRMEWLVASFPGRVLTVSFDRFCRHPHAMSREILDFCGACAKPEALDSFAAKVIVPESSGRFRVAGLDGFAETDLNYVESCGYSLC